MLRFKYRNRSLPPANPPGGHLYWLVHIDGDIEITIGSRSSAILECELLLSLAVVLKRWLQMLKFDEFSEMYYSSMNHAEEPILKFSPIEGTNNWNLESVWENSFEPISREDLIEGVEDYLQTLDTDLTENYSALDLEAEYREHVDEYLLNRSLLS